MEIVYSREYLVIHLLLHNPTADIVQIGGKDIPIRVHQEGHRFVQFYSNDELVTFSQQSLREVSVYTQRAKAGERISWVYRRGKPWVRIDREIEENFPDLFPK